MGRYRIRKRKSRWEVFLPRGEFLGPVLMTGGTYESVLARLCAVLKDRQSSNLQRARAI